MSGLGNVEVASSEAGRAITIYLAGESARVGIALGYRVPKFNGETAERWADFAQRETWSALDTMLTPKSAASRNWRASMAQDVMKGRPTEIDYMWNVKTDSNEDDGTNVNAGERKELPAT